LSRPEQERRSRGRKVDEWGMTWVFRTKYRVGSMTTREKNEKTNWVGKAGVVTKGIPSGFKKILTFHGKIEVATHR